MHCFSVATNLCQRFVIGYEDEKDNFYLRGEIVNDNPEVSCRVYSREGRFCYGLDRNSLSADTHPKYRYMLTKERLPRVVDDKGKEQLRIETKKDEKANVIVHIEGEFFDKHGNLAARGDVQGLVLNCPLKIG